MKIYPRARRAIFHWFFGRAACCGILLHAEAETTQHAAWRRAAWRCIASDVNAA